MKIELVRDKDGYLAKVAGRKNLFAFGYTKQDALEELAGVGAGILESGQDVRQLEKRVAEYLHKLEHDG